MDRKDKLIKLYERIYSRKNNARILSAIGLAGTLYVGTAYVFVALRLFAFGSYLEAVGLFLAVLIPFALVSVLRILLDLPRPYEVVDYEPFTLSARGRKRGGSFPSRHVLCAFTIGVLLIKYSAVLGVCTLLVGVYIGTERTLRGIHFPKDVIAGSIIGVVSGIIGLLIL